MSPLRSLFGRVSGPAPLPFAPTSPEGLVARWVRWVATHGSAKNPVRDATGEHAGHHQPDDVWFLAGSYGGSVTRRCALPAGRPLFFPAFNMWRYPARAGEVPMASRATGHAQLAGVPLPLATIGTPTPFEVRGALGNGVTSSSRPTPVTCWGLWASLPPLASGAHELTFGGTDGDGFWVRAEYRLVVH
ncbi:hypothetical protein [Micromonospora siamensis]|uniref:Uncharacterized protein n=1 Tax=Micromonospora siamensis TaxID=299152 RepID=A0A1C5HMU6_9ACTN|nr:hypothetical protein [Micromonospora siamensis]SCG47340.1 hypothetical protein GA0074704_2026 [Micromonospora siamensis]